MSAKSALWNHHAKLANAGKRKADRGGKKNGKPEKEIEKQVLAWAAIHSIHLHVVESKAVYSVAAGQYLRGQAEAGLPDLIGNIEGLSTWVELKAKGRRGTLKEHQRGFLVRKIEQGCFAACIDSVDQLSQLLASFISMPSSDRVQLLLDHLPKSRHPVSTSLEEELF